MNSKRLFYVLCGTLIALFVGLIAGTYGVNSLLTSQATKLTNLKAKSLALDQQRVSLTKAKQDLKTYANLEKIAQAVVPEDKNQAEAVREIVNIAGANGIGLTAINFPASTLGLSATGTTTAPSAAKPVAPSANSKANGLSQLQPVKNIPGVYLLTITVQGDPNRPVPYDRFINFLSALEHNRRTAQVSTITIQPNASNRTMLTFTLSLNEYIKP